MAENKEKKERTVIHLYLVNTDEHHYFGSIANLFEYYDAATLGISYGSLRNYGLCAEKPYRNKLCVIRKGLLLSKSGNRGVKKLPQTSHDAVQEEKPKGKLILHLTNGNEKK